MPDADEARPIPSLQAVDFHGQQFHFVPAVDFMQPVAQEQEDISDSVAESLEAGMPDLIGGAFRDDVSTLPIVVAVEHNQHPPAFDASYDSSRIAILARYAEPHDVHRRAQVLDAEASALTHRRMPSIAADGQGSTDFDLTIRRFCPHACYSATVEEQIGCVCAHSQIETRIAPRAVGQEIEEIPLRHQCDEFAVHRQVLEIPDDQVIVSNLQ